MTAKHKQQQQRLRDLLNLPLYIKVDSPHKRKHKVLARKAKQKRKL